MRDLIKDIKAEVYYLPTQKTPSPDDFTGCFAKLSSNKPSQLYMNTSCEYQLSL